MEVEPVRDAARLAAARAGLAAAPDARAAGPGPNAESLRSAYLDVLELCLCDLAGPSTLSVGLNPDGALCSRELKGSERAMRLAGMDWPLEGLTTIGPIRLDDLQSCVESVVHDGVEGDFIETGAWRGGASVLVRAALDAIGVEDRTVWLSDSFRGLPGGDDDHEATVAAFLTASVDEVRENFARFGLEHGLRFVSRRFEDPPMVAGRRWAIVRLDGDAYGTTEVALRSLYPDLSEGGYLIVDDYGAADGCREAVDAFRREHGISEPLEAVDWTCVRWRRGSEAPEGGPPSGAAAVDDPREHPPLEANGARARESRVPTVRERELAQEIEGLRDRLAATQEQIGRLQDSPLRGLAAWVRRRIDGGSSTR